MHHEGYDQDVDSESSLEDDDIQISEECPICLDTLEDAIALLPCNHVFDILCFRHWIKARLPQNIACPLCRSSVLKLLLNRGKEDEKEVLLSEILTDEELAATRRVTFVDQTSINQVAETLRWQEAQWRRLDARGAISVTYEPIEYMSIIAPFEDGIAVVSRRLSLNVTQLGNRTDSTLRRWLKIDYYKPKFTSKFRDLQSKASYSSRPAMHRARQEIADLQEEYSEALKWPNMRNMRWVYQQPEQYLAFGDRGVRKITLSKKARATETPRALQLSSGKTSISIKWTTRLTERGPTRPDGDPVTFGRETPQILRIRKKVKFATEQIRSALEWFRDNNADDRFSRIDRVTTNILEPAPQEVVQCRHCPARHIPGHCPEQWSLDFP
ncbi:hypothetical protein V8E51_009352 [Hyaloscypha variabilis]